MSTASDVQTATTTYINYAQSQMATAISNLSSAAAGWSAASWSALTKPATGTYNPFNAETDSQISTAMAAFDTALAAITPGTLNTVPGLTGYTAPVWSETFWTNLKGLLTTFTGNITGSDDIDTVVTKLTNETNKLQVALYAADRERKQQALRDAHSAAASATGARGFTYPNSMTTALKLAATQQYMFDLSQTSRELIKTIFEWAKSNYQFSVEKQISAHNVDVDFNLRYADALIKVYSEQVHNVLQEYRDKVAVKISEAEQKIKSYALRLEVIKTNASVSAEQDRINATNFATEVQQHATDVARAVETAASNARNKIEAAVAAVNAAASMVTSASQISIGILNG